MAGMKALVAVSKRTDGCTTYQLNVAEAIFDGASNAAYCSVSEGHDRVVKAATDIVALLLVNVN